MKKIEYDKHPTKCNLCGGKVIYNWAVKEKSLSGFVYYCTECHAWVGTHPVKKDEALGLLADFDTRKARANVHRWFDKLWHNHEEREMWYHKLAQEMNMEECHFSQMNLEELNQALDIIKKWWMQKYDI